MRVTVYTEACYLANGKDAAGITVEIDLDSFLDVPTSPEIHALLPDTLLSRLGVAADTDCDITIVESTDPQWAWFQGVDPSTWTIAQAWEFSNECEQLDSSNIEEFGLFVTNYWNVRDLGASGIVQAFHDSYCGTYSSGADYARETHAETCDRSVDLDQWPYTCIDWEAAWKELVTGGDNTDYELRNGDVAIFSDHF